MRIKRFNEDIYYDSNESKEDLGIMGSNAWQSPHTNSVVKLSVTKNKDGKNNAIVIKTNENGVVINDPAGIDKIIDWLMEYKDTMY